MLTRRCYLADEPRFNEDVCHPYCLSVEAIETQAKMYELQKELLAQMRVLGGQLIDLAEAIRLASGYGAGGQALAGGDAVSQPPR